MKSVQVAERAKIRSIPEVIRLAKIRAEELSNGTLTLEQLSPLDQEGCWLAAEDEAISQAERWHERQIERTA